MIKWPAEINISDVKSFDDVIRREAHNKALADCKQAVAEGMPTEGEIEEILRNVSYETQKIAAKSYAWLRVSREQAKSIVKLWEGKE